jgi:hypothetical protein
MAGVAENKWANEFELVIYYFEDMRLFSMVKNGLYTHL